MSSTESKSPATMSAAPAPGAAAPCRQLQLMAMGIPSIGKSSNGEVLAKLFAGGKYIDQDDCKSNAKEYHKQVKLLSANPAVKMLYLGKCCHKSQVRDGTFAALSGSTSRQILVGLYFYHPLDDKEEKEGVVGVGGKNRHLLALALERINKRGYGHKNLYPDHNTAAILAGFAKELEPPTEKEMDKFVTVIRVDATLDKLATIKYILQELNSLGLLEGHSLLGSPTFAVTDETIVAAIEAVSAKERTLEASLKTLFWGISASKPAVETILARPEIKAALTEAKIKPFDQLHSTMLYVNGNPALATEDKELFSWDRKEIKLTIREVVWDMSAVALVVDKNFPCQNEIAHITVGVSPKVKPMYSNTMLAQVTCAAQAASSSTAAIPSSVSATAKRQVLDPPLEVIGYVKRFFPTNQ